MPPTPSLYEIPLVLHNEGLDEYVCDILGLGDAPVDLTAWEELVRRVEEATTPVRIGMIGKYVALPDAYLSVVESLNHAGIHHGADIEIEWIQAEEVEGSRCRSSPRPRRHRHSWWVRRARCRRQGGRCGVQP